MNRGDFGNAKTDGSEVRIRPAPNNIGRGPDFYTVNVESETVMADTVVNQQNGGNTFGTVFSGLIDLGKTGLTAYFADDAAKAALKSPPANTAIVIGGVVVVAVLIFLVLKK